MGPSWRNWLGRNQCVRSLLKKNLLAFAFTFAFTFALALAFAFLLLCGLRSAAPRFGAICPLFIVCRQQGRG